MNTESFGETIRNSAAAFLLAAFETAIASYQNYAGSAVEPEKFAEHHKALRVALAHMELLMKLVRMALLLPSPAVPDGERVLLATLMNEAENEVRTYQVNFGNDDE